MIFPLSYTTITARKTAYNRRKEKTNGKSSSFNVKIILTLVPVQKDSSSADLSLVLKKLIISTHVIQFNPLLLYVKFAQLLGIYRVYFCK